MARRIRNALPSDVETDCCCEPEEPRVPSLGLHPSQHGDSVDHVDGSLLLGQRNVHFYRPDSNLRKDTDGYRCDSGYANESTSLSIGACVSQDFGYVSSVMPNPFTGEEYQSSQASDEWTKLDAPTLTSVEVLPPSIENFRISSPSSDLGDSEETVESFLDEAYVSGDILVSGESGVEPSRSPLSSFDIINSGSTSQGTKDIYPSFRVTDLQKQKQEEITRIFEPDEDGDTELHLAIIQNMEAFALYLVSMAAFTEMLSRQNNLGQTPLHLATLTCRTSVIRHLIRRGVPLDMRDRNGNTALHVACREGLLTCVQALTEPLTQQELSGLPSMVCGPTYNPPYQAHLMNYDGYTCVHLAAASNHMSVLAYLISSKILADINIRDGRSGRTALHHAVEAGQVDLVFFILHHCHADYDTRTFEGYFALQLAEGRRYTSIKKLLLQAGADIGQLALLLDDDDESSDSDTEDMDVEMQMSYLALEHGRQAVTTSS